MVDGWTLEVTRVCTVNGFKNAASMLYGAAWRAAKAMGYKRVISYILDSEKGTSLVAAGYQEVGAAGSIMTQKDWYSYGEIRYTLSQILFLLEHRDLLESGRWPSEHKETGYTGSSKGRTYKTEGYFVKAIVVIAELNIRLAA
ncbi:hypothetical protein LCGC14_2286450, partial [marine sediment metagenome]